MNKIGKEYISEVKTLFPIKSKKEKEYLKKLASDIDCFCNDVNINSKKDLYDNYGKPMDVVNSYFSTIETEYIVKKIRIAKYIKIAISIILTFALVATSAYCIHQYIGIQIMKDQEVVIVEEIIEEY